MPIQQPQWSDYLSCHICCNLFDEEQYRPISLACGHTLCKACLSKLPQKKCPFDQTAITRPASELPVNFALLQLIGVAVPDQDDEVKDESAKHYYNAKRSIEKLAIYLNPLANGTSAGSTSLGSSSPLTRPMQRKLVALVNCQLVEEEGRVRAMRVARSLGERSVTELILLHQNPQQLSTNLWAAVRARGCQFLGPAMQEEVLKLILLALEDGSALSRKVLVLFVVQRLETQYPQASKTAIGHVVQLLYRASCFKVTKREEESSLMQLKEEFRGYEALRREHDAQIVQIASEAGLRISPEQWSSLLYGDTAHKSHMQSIIDKLQTPQSFAQSVNELMIALQRSHDPNDLSSLQQHLETLTNVDPTSDAPLPSWESIEMVLNAVCKVVQGLVEFIQIGGCSGPASATAGLTTRDALDANTLLQHAKFKTSLCRDMTQIGRCPRGNNCTFAHSSEELERYRARSKRFAKLGSVSLKPGVKVMTSSALTPQEQADLAAITQTAQAKLAGRHLESHDCETAYRMVDMFGDEEDICVPVAQPCSLPPNKTSRQPIYMLLSHNTSQQLEPDIVASACKAPSYTPLPSTTILHDPLQGLPISSSANAMYAQIRTGRPMQPDYHVGPSQVKNRGKSPSQKLEELHKRRSELLSQLISPSSQEMSGLAAHNPDQASYPAEAPFKTPDVYGGHSSTPVSIAGVGIHACRMARSSSPASHCLAEDAENVSVATISASNNLSSTYIGTNSAHIGTSFGSHNTFLGSSHIGSSPAHFETSPANSGTNSAILSNFEGTSCIYSETSPSHDGQLCPENEMLTTRSLLPGCVPSLFPGSDMSHQVSPHTSCYNAVSQENIVEGYQLWPVLTVGKQDDLPGTSFHSGEDVHHLGEASWCNLEHDDDEFIPFEVNVVSKYGPISRGVRARTGNTAPLQVTAAQRMPFNTVQVSSVTSQQRPYPVSGEVPSRFASSHKEFEATNMMLHPLGQTIASSLPTAMMAPNVLAASNFPHKQMSLWAFKDQVMKTGSKAPSSVAEDVGCDLQLRHELACVSHQIQSLEKSENGRLSRELQAIELNIQETERSMHMQKQDEGLATKEQQEATDYKLAQQLALQEVQYHRQASRPTDS